MAIHYVDEIRRYDSSGQLLDFLKSLPDIDAVSGWNPGKAFEHIILRAFELEGAEIKWPFTVPIEGEVVEQIDGVVYHGWLQCLVESKDYSEPINFEPIAKLRAQLTRRPPCTMGIIFARSNFTKPAKTLTRLTSPANVLLWEYEELEIGLTKSCMLQALTTKLRRAVEDGLPDYSIVNGLWGQEG